MVSVVSAGTADRIAARILFKVLRVGSGRPARYSSTFFGVPLALAAELRVPDFTFFMRQCYKGLHFESMSLTSMSQTNVQPFYKKHRLEGIGPSFLPSENWIPEPNR